MALDESVVAAVANSDFKTNSELHSQDLVAHRNRSWVLAENALAGQVNRMLSLNVEDAIAMKQATTGHAGAENAIQSALGMSAIQGLIKGAQTTPPQTGTGG